MDYTIHVKPSEVWEFFMANREQLEEEMVCIAQNNDIGTFVYLTEEKGCARFCVCEEDCEVHNDYAVSEEDCEQVADDLYADYIWDFGEDDSIEERESVLWCASADFLKDVLEYTETKDMVQDYGEALIDEFINDACRILREKYGISVYRPTPVQDEDGNTDIIEYPYEEAT